MLKSIYKLHLFFLETLFPRFCIECGKEGRYICEKCTLFISEANFVCPVCQKTSYFGKRHRRCKKSRELDGLVNAWDYDGPIKKAIHSIKYGGIFHLLEEITENIFLLAEKDQIRFSLFLSFLTDENTVITFVPVSSDKKKERGFDQSNILADYVGKAVNKKAIKLIERIRNTESQASLDKKERALNVENAFSFIPSRNTGVEKVLIIDDIWTSGATMRECCQTLKENGAKEVWGFTLAKA